MIKKSLLLTTLILISLSFFAQSVKISGVVYDANKKPLSHVSVSSKDIGQTNGTFTTNKGEYSLNIITKDSVKIIFSSIGFQTIYLTIPPLTEDINLNVIMKDADQNLESVVINADGKSRMLNMTVDVFDPKRRSYLLDSSIESLLFSFSGVSSTNELSSQYLVRGGNFDENVIYVNGVEIHRPLLIRSGQQEGLSFINPNMVQSVAFSSGGYNAEYGDRMSSVLDVQYKKPQRFEGSVGASLMDGSVYIGNATNTFSQMTSVRYKNTRSVLNTTDTRAEYDPSFLDLQSYMTYSLSPKWDISFLGNYSRNAYQFTPQTRSTNFGTVERLRNFKVFFDGWEDDKFITYQGALTLKGKINDNLELGIMSSAFSSDEHERFDIEGRYRLTEINTLDGSDSETNNLLGIGTYHNHARNKLDIDVYNITHFGSLKLDKHLIKWGLSFQQEQIKDRISEWEMRDSTGYSLPNDGITVNMFSNLKSNNKVNSTRISGYLQERYQFNTDRGLFTLNAGLRASYWDFNNELLVSPRLALLFIPAANENFTFRLAGGAYYQAPFYREYQQVVDVEGNNVIVPNKDIKSQKSQHFILGSDYHFKSGERAFKFSSELFYKRLSDVIPYTIDNVRVRYSGENEGTGYITGIDMQLYGEFVTGTSSWISLSLMKTRQDINGIKTPLPTDQRYNISVYLQDYFPGYDRIKMSFRGAFSDGLPFAAPNKSFSDGYFRAPAYKRADIGFSWEILGENYAIRNKNSFCKVFKNVWLGLDVFNLFDIKNVNTYYWITDVYSNQYAIPNYLTGRQLNIRLLADF
ncbi:TonB-dependent receptor [Dysgonomonas sp. ZJ709]|uniref:TonB-dependent receptor n=1 Tax=Dysgonomonas sp. ZJ709 TaxID=2709797 RepID=UPI0013EB0FD2|nr:TonB-dependent receptor [Dysgonomonas sp. ZJ709]